MGSIGDELGGNLCTEHPSAAGRSQVPATSALGANQLTDRAGRRREWLIRSHCATDDQINFLTVDARVGQKRAQGAYAWASLYQTGVRIAGGSDFPVESHNPFLGLFAGITRQNAEGWPEGGWMPDQRMTREEALASYTVANAYAAFEEHLKGTITPGKLADITVLSDNIMTIPMEQIPATRVEMTIVGGEVRYRR